MGDGLGVGVGEGVGVGLGLGIGLGGRGVKAVGVTPAEGLDAALVPMPLVAVTVNVYVVPLVRPVTVHEVPAVVQVVPPGAAVAV